jgi:hypothetical protein
MEQKLGKEKQKCFNSFLTFSDSNGNCMVTFELPKTITSGEGTLNFVIEDGGVLETASKTIPIILEFVDVKIYPEGGDLVGDLESGIYIECFNRQGDPADISRENQIHSNFWKEIFLENQQTFRSHKDD